MNVRFCIKVIISVFLVSALIFSLFPRVSCKYAEEEPVYVEDLGNVWHFHNYFDDFYVDKGGLQISNNLSQPWAYVVAGVSFTFRGRSYSFWTDSLPLEWIAFNGSDFAELNGTALLVSGRFGSLRFTLNYHLVWNSSYIRITPVLAADLKYPVENVILHYRMEDISIDGNIAGDFCVFRFNNETYRYFLPAYFEHSTVNITESLNHLFIYDNVTWKFVDYVWEWNYTLNQMQSPVNVTLIGDGANVQADFNYGDFPLQFIFNHTFWWHDPVETRYFKNAQHTVNGLEAWQLATDQTGTLQTEGESRGAYYGGCDVGIRVWKRHSDGSEEEITAGTPVAQVTVSAGASHELHSATWDCPQTSLADTDAIIVRVYHNMGGEWDLIGTTEFITEQLGASQLDASTWTVYYYLSFTATTFPAPRSSVSFHFDGADNSRIEEFSYTTGEAREWHDITTWNFNLTTRKWFNVASWNFNVSTMQWNDISVWSFSLAAKAWCDIASWNFNLITKTWNNIAQWTWNLVTYGWHTISYWTITLTIETQKKLPFIILIGGIFTVLIAIFMFYKR